MICHRKMFVTEICHEKFARLDEDLKYCWRSFASAYLHLHEISICKYYKTHFRLEEYTAKAYIIVIFNSRLTSFLLISSCDFFPNGEQLRDNSLPSIEIEEW